MKKQNFAVVKALAAAFLLCLACESFAAAPKYIFLMIGDGMSTPQRSMGEEFSRKAGLGDIAMNHLPFRASTRTYSANSVVTDSAASATAIACGVKTKNGMLGVDPATNRLESVAAVAKKAGRKVGIMTTVTIVHATPAAFYAHRSHRGMSYRIALDLVASGYDYFAGGGVYNKYDDKDSPGYRGNVFDLARKAGYTVSVGDVAAWKALKPGSKSWTVFTDNALPYSIDKDVRTPTLAEILKKGIEVLDGPEGFFIMCEGGKIDYAGHANDAATNIRDLIAFDEAVKVALAFQDAHPDDTLVITTGDHETGGLSVGLAGVGGAFRVELLANQTMSGEMFDEKVKKIVQDRNCEIAFEEIKPELEKAFGFVFPGPNADPANPMLLSPGEVESLRKAFEKDVGLMAKKIKDPAAYDAARKYIFTQTAKNVIAAHAGVAWSTGSHTALPTLTTAKGPGAKELLSGMTDNIEIGQRLKRLIRGE